jgi:hypothetical protein
MSASSLLHGHTWSVRNFKTKSLCAPGFFLILATALVLPRNAPAQDDPSAFGQTQQGESALTGIMYDLKQTPTHQASKENANTYFDVVTDFLKSGWDEDVLNRFYSVSRPLYTTQIFVPNMDANDAPKAFGAEKTVQPGQWIIHYKGQVSAPAPGTYRFWGAADDLLAVGIDGKTELAYYLGLPATPVWKPSQPDGIGGADVALRPGDWFTVTAGQIIDLDVIIGERPGGQFNAFLEIEKKGETYKPGQGGLIFPIFQVAPFDTPQLQQNLEPSFAKGYPPWKCLQ